MDAYIHLVRIHHAVRFQALVCTSGKFLQTSAIVLEPRKGTVTVGVLGWPGAVGKQDTWERPTAKLLWTVISAMRSEEQSKRYCVTQTTKYYSAIDRHKLEAFVNKWVHMKTTIVREKNQIHNLKYHMVSHL